jgi:hypothetical protein
MTLLFGPCRLCPKGSPAKRLYADNVCSYHLGHPKEDLSKEIHEVEPVTDPHEKKLLDKFFKEQAMRRPEFCENGCKTVLVASQTWRLKAFVCHILPKRHFKSVIIHPANVWYGCLDCHHDYDDRGWTHAVTMKVWPLVTERFREFMALIPDNELKYLPDPFRLILNSTT